MPSYEDARIEKFKSTIHFASEFRRVELPGQVVITWPQPSELTFLTKERWVKRNSRVDTEPISDSKTYLFVRGEHKISVDIYVAHERNEDAVDYLFQRATSTTMVDIPFVVGPRDLGHFSLQNSDPVISELYWVFYNICVHIDCADETMDVMPLARYFQEQMQMGLVPSAQAARPQVERIEVSTKRVLVDQEFRTWLVFPESSAVPDFKVRISYDSDRLRSVDSSELGWVLRAKTPGRAAINFEVTDTRTLLNNSFSTFVDVVQ